MSEGFVRAARWVAVLAMASMVPLWACMTASVRGPIYLEINTDPEYAYLTNSLLLAEGKSPIHTDHPGTPVQMLGAAIIKLTHMAAGQGRMRDDVLLRPEMYLAVMRVTTVAIVFLLSVWAGRLALRATGRMAHAALVQIAPLATASCAVMLDRCQPEPLMLGLGMVVSGIVLVILHRPPGAREVRAGVVAGTLIGVTTAIKITFAPALVLPLAAMATARARVVCAACALVAFFVSVLPIAPMFGRVAKWLYDVMTHTGRYGTGDEGIVDVHVYGRDLLYMVRSEPTMAVLGGAAAVVGLGVVVMNRGLLRDERTRRLWVCLAAAAGIQIGMVLAIAKQPKDYYLCATAGIIGVGLSVALTLAERALVLRGRFFRIAAVAVPVIVVAGVVGARIRSFVDWRASTSTLVAGELTVRPYLADPAHRDVMHGWRISTPEAALYFANTYSGFRFSSDLRRLYPSVWFCENERLTAFGPRVGQPGFDARYPGQTFEAVISPWFDRPLFTFPGPYLSTVVSSFGRERLLAFRPLGDMARDSVVGPDGIVVVKGLAGEEGPYGGVLPTKVRWGIGKATVLEFDSRGGATELMLECRTCDRNPQTLTVVVNGQEMARHEFTAPPTFEAVRTHFEARPGRNVMELRYERSVTAGQRELSVLFRRIRVGPALNPAKGATAQGP